MSRSLRFIVLVMALSPAALFGQGISGVIVTAPRLILMSGEQIQVQALARDSQGNPRNNDRFNFNSTNRNVVNIDSAGIVTGAI